MKKSLIGLMLLCATAFAAAPKDTLVLQVAGTMDTFDPQQAYDTNVVTYVATNIYETLITFEANTLKVTPLLATSWEQSGDGLSYSFTLREGVTFHSGNPMTCADAEYSFRRLLITGNSSSTAFLVSDPLLGFQYWDEELIKNTPFSAISKAVSCDSSGRLVFTLAKPSPTFFLKLTGSWAGILDQQFMIQNGEWDGAEASWQEWIAKDVSNSILNQQSAGTGAYRMVSRQTDLAVFQVFDGYWGETPALKNVVIQAIAEDASRVLAIQNGDADLISYLSRSVLGQVEGAAGVTVNEFPSTASSAIFLIRQLLRAVTLLAVVS
jgi:peptide/nickel transport system substrate-binding protein